MAVQKEIQELKEQSLAMELLKDARKTNKRIFIVLVIVLCMWFATIGIFIYYINTTGYEEDIREQTIEDIDNLDNTNITNGDIYDESYPKKKN